MLYNNWVQFCTENIPSITGLVEYLPYGRYRNGKFQL